MYWFLLSILLMVCLGIDNNVHCRNINETDTVVPDTTSFPSSTETSLIVRRNCSTQEFKHIWLILISCIDSQFNETEIQVHLGNLTQSIEIFNKSCENISTCFQKVLSDLDEYCVQDNNVQNERIMLNLINNWLSFWCHDHGRRLATFYHQGGLSCWKNKTQEIDRCLKTDSINITNKTCNMITESLICFDGVFYDCQLSETSINMFQSSFDGFYKTKGCSVYRSNKNQT